MRSTLGLRRSFLFIELCMDLVSRRSGPLLSARRSFLSVVSRLVIFLRGRSLSVDIVIELEVDRGRLERLAGGSVLAEAELMEAEAEVELTEAEAELTEATETLSVLGVERCRSANRLVSSE